MFRLTSYSNALRASAWISACLACGAAGCGDSKPRSRPSAAATPRETINKTTQNVLKLQDALDQGGKIAEGSGEVGVSGGYLGTVTAARRSALSSIASMAVERAMQMYDIQNNGPVKDYDEFMTGIIKKGQADGLQLPMLPFYQEYAYDEANRKLVVVEFAARKDEYEKSAR